MRSITSFAKNFPEQDAAAKKVSGEDCEKLADAILEEDAKRTTFKEEFPEQAARVAEQVQYMHSQRDGGSEYFRSEKGKEELTAIADDILNEPKTHNKLFHVPLSERIKHNILLNLDDMTASGDIGKRNAGGMCLVCGKCAVRGDVVLADTTGEGNFICLQCCTEHNAADERHKLFVCK